MKRIALIDDDPLLRETFSARLRDAGYVVFEAANGREAIQHVLAQPIDLAITDMLMPEMEGVETIRLLRRFSPTLKIIAISGGGVLDGECYLSVARKLGADKTLAKPFTVFELIKSVVELVGEPGTNGVLKATTSRPGR